VLCAVQSETAACVLCVVRSETAACVLCVVQSETGSHSALHTTHMPLYIIYIYIYITT